MSQGGDFAVKSRPGHLKSQQLRLKEEEEEAHKLEAEVTKEKRAIQVRERESQGDHVQKATRARARRSLLRRRHLTKEAQHRMQQAQAADMLDEEVGDVDNEPLATTTS